MGCDIHAHIDVDGYHFGEFDISRDYTLFHGLAGVRSGQFKQVFPLRGVPEVISWETRDRLAQLDVDAHSISWLNTDELHEVFLQYVEVVNKPHTDIEAILAAMDVLEKSNPNKVLFIFWFDN
jgi:hypothetical protein